MASNDSHLVQRLHGRVGIWSVGLRRADVDAAVQSACELDSLGFAAVWIPGSSGGDLFDRVAAVLDATRSIVAATGVLNVWMHTVEEVAARSSELSAQFDDRFLLGIGCSHRPLVDRLGLQYSAPLAKVAAFLDGLDDSTHVPPSRRVLAALGPRMLALAAARSAGAHPFNVTPTHTAMARQALGPASFLAPELKVILETAPTKAREIARAQLGLHLKLPNYVANLKRLGFGDDDLSGAGSDRLVDALVAWGDEETVRRRVAEHIDAGANHVCINVLTPDLADLPIETWRRLASALCPPG